MYSGVKHEPHETGVICSEKLLLDSTLNFTTTPRLFSTRNVWMHSTNLYPDCGEKKQMREKASNKAARGYRRGVGNVKKSVFSLISSALRLRRAVLAALGDIDEEEHFRYFMMFASQQSATFNFASVYPHRTFSQPHVSIQRSVCLSFGGMQIGKSRKM